MKCPHCKGDWNSELGCLNPSCEYGRDKRTKFTFVKGTSDDQKQAIIYDDYDKWSKTRGGSQISPNEKSQNVLSEPIIQDPVSPMPQHPEQREQEYTNQNDTELGTKEESEIPYIPADNGLYSLGWGDKHPGHIVYLIDLSESMRWDDYHNIKDVIEVLRECIKRMVTDCTPGEAEPIERFSISVIGYNSKIIHLLPNKNVADLEEYLIERKKLPLFDIYEGGNAYPQYQTYMASAFDAAAEDIKEWISQQRENGMKIPAPYVIHVTDGHPEESDENEREKNIPEEKAMEKALKAASRLKEIKGDDGNVLLFNIHYDSAEKNIQELITPSSRPSGSSIYDKRKQFLYDVSSVLPERIVKKINDMVKSQEEKETDPFVKYVHNGSRAMISNAKNKKLLNNFIVFSSLTGTRK